MFSGIIEKIATIMDCKRNGSNIDLTLQCEELEGELYIDQSISHDGICLTVVNIEGSTYKVTAIKETIEITTIKNWKTNDKINLERAIGAQSRMDGHFVQGHVDGVAQCLSIKNADGSWNYQFSVDPIFEKYLVPKGSICINGISLTLVEVINNQFTVSIIPYTYSHTNFQSLRIGSLVNIEFDILGKYIIKFLENRQL